MLLLLLVYMILLSLVYKMYMLLLLVYKNNKYGAVKTTRMTFNEKRKKQSKLKHERMYKNKKINNNKKLKLAFFIKILMTYQPLLGYFMLKSV